MMEHFADGALVWHTMHNGIFRVDSSDLDPNLGMGEHYRYVGTTLDLHNKCLITRCLSELNLDREVFEEEWEAILKMMYKNNFPSEYFLILGEVPRDVVERKREEIHSKANTAEVAIISAKMRLTAVCEGDVGLEEMVKMLVLNDALGSAIDHLERYLL